MHRYTNSRIIRPCSIYSTVMTAQACMAVCKVNHKKAAIVNLWVFSIFFQQDFDDQLVAFSVRDIVQQDYGALFDIQEDTAMRTYVERVDPTF